MRLNLNLIFLKIKAEGYMTYGVFLNHYLEFVAHVYKSNTQLFWLTYPDQIRDWFSCKFEGENAFVFSFTKLKVNLAAEYLQIQPNNKKAKRFVRDLKKNLNTVNGYLEVFRGMMNNYPKLEDFILFDDDFYDWKNWMERKANYDQLQIVESIGNGLQEKSAKFGSIYEKIKNEWRALSEKMEKCNSALRALTIIQMGEYLVERIDNVNTKYLKPIFEHLEPLSHFYEQFLTERKALARYLIYDHTKKSKSNVLETKHLRPASTEPSDYHMDASESKSNVLEKTDPRPASTSDYYMETAASHTEEFESLIRKGPKVSQESKPEWNIRTMCSKLIPHMSRTSGETELKKERKSKWDPRYFSRIKSTSGPYMGTTGSESSLLKTPQSSASSIYKVPEENVPLNSQHSKPASTERGFGFGFGIVSSIKEAIKEWFGKSDYTMI